MKFAAFSGTLQLVYLPADHVTLLVIRQAVHDSHPALMYVAGYLQTFPIYSHPDFAGEADSDSCHARLL